MSLSIHDESLNCDLKNTTTINVECNYEIYSFMITVWICICSSVFVIPSSIFVLIMTKLQLQKIGIVVLVTTVFHQGITLYLAIRIVMN